MKNYRHYPPTICWDCANAIGKCSWSKNFTPVENWEAQPTQLKPVDRRNIIIHSFIVKSCPQFVKG